MVERGHVAYDGIQFVDFEHVREALVGFGDYIDGDLRIAIPERYENVSQRRGGEILDNAETNTPFGVERVARHSISGQVRWTTA